MDDPHVPNLSIVIVSWNVRDLLRACLRSIASSPRIAFRQAGAPGLPAPEDPAPGTTFEAEVIVIDNASADGSAAMVAAEFPWVCVIANPDNRGFTVANNQGLARAGGQYVLFLNPDTVVVDDALATMAAYMQAHPKVGALGPQLFYGDGRRQSSRRRFPTLATAIFESTPLAWHWPDNPWARRYHLDDTPADRVQEVDWIVGAAMLVRRELLDRIGGFDEGYFMYSEELDWCRRCRDAGWQVVYLPEARLIHYEGRSSDQVIAARHVRFQTSKVRYFRKFHGPLAAEALRVFILVAFALEWLIEAAKWLLGSKRQLRRARLAAYCRLLRSGLRPAAGRPVAGTP